MIISTYIRPLVLEDAKTSYLWRNDPKVWIFTNYKVSGYISPQMETAWLKDNLNKKDQSRFAICLEGSDMYIGNIQLLNIKEQTAELHLFIGNKLYWGKSIGYQATKLIIRHGFLEHRLEKIFLKVHPANLPALYLYEKAGFEITGKDEGLILMTITKSKFLAGDQSNQLVL